MVGEDGNMLYCFIVEYRERGLPKTFYLWANDEEDAMTQLYWITQGARVRERLSDHVEQQNVPRKKLVDSDDPNPMGVA